MNLLPDASLLVIMGIFWITYLILRSCLFGPLSEILRERRETVETARAEHDAAVEQTEEKLEAERVRLNETRAEAAARREELRRAAEARRQEILGTTREETEQRLREAGSELEADVERERAELEGRARTLAGHIADRLLEKSA